MHENKALEIKKTSIQLGKESVPSSNPSFPVESISLDHDCTYQNSQDIPCHLVSLMLPLGLPGAHRSEHPSLHPAAVGGQGWPEQ